MTTLQQAEKIVEKARRESLKKREQMLDEWIDSKIGKTFVYRNNSYGCSSDLKWDSFKIILKKINNHSVLVEEWDLIDPKNENFEISRSVDYVYDWNLQEGRGDNHFNDYPLCSMKEFQENKNKILKLLQNTKVTEGSP